MSLRKRTSVEVDEASLGYILRIALPMVIATISYTLMQFVDRWMVGLYDEKALAAILPASMISFVPSSFLLGLMTTVNTFVSQSFGQKSLRDCSHYCWQAIYLGLLYSVLTFAIIWPLSPQIFAWMNQPESLIPMEVTYLRIMLLGQFAVVFIWATNQFFMGIHRAQITMVTALISQVVNVAANYVLIFGKWGCPEMGIEGAGWGTFIGALVNGLTRVFYFIGPRIHSQFQSRSTLRLDGPKIWDLLRIGAPAGFAFCTNTAVVGAILFRLMGGFGETALAATSAVYSCVSLSFMPVVGLGTALTAAVGKSIGRQRPDEVERQTRHCLKIALIYMGCVGLCFYFFRDHIMAIWDLSPETAALGAKILICAAFFQVFDAAVITYSGVLRGAGDTPVPGLDHCGRSGLGTGPGRMGDRHHPAPMGGYWSLDRLYPAHRFRRHFQSHPF